MFETIRAKYRYKMECVRLQMQDKCDACKLKNNVSKCENCDKDLGCLIKRYEVIVNE